jgi:hypothetical protein
MTRATFAVICFGLLLAGLAPAVSAYAAVEPGAMQAPRTQAGATARAQTVTGWVTALIAANHIGTSILSDHLQRRDFNELDAVQVHINGQTLAARVMTRRLFEAYMRDESLRAALDVSVICLLERRGRTSHMEIIDLRGGQSNALEVRPQMRVAVERIGL